jgi:hypothetical protein
MGVYKGLGDQAWQPYVASRGTNRTLLAKIALRPKAKWFGGWISNAAIRDKVVDYIANSTGGDPEVLVQMAVFRMVPWEHEACKRLPTRAEQASYKQWVDRFAAGAGDAHVALILHPDGPFALCAPGGSRLPSQLIRYSARKFSALPNTSVYLDGGAADWPKDRPAESARFLLPAGIEYARGFALNSTHYSPTYKEIEFGHQTGRRARQPGCTGQALRRQHVLERTRVRLRDGRRLAPGQRERVPDEGRAALRHSGHPADDRRHEPALGTLGVPPGPGSRARRRLSVVRSALAAHAGRSVRPAASAGPGPHHPVLRRLGSSGPGRSQLPDITPTRAGAMPGKTWAGEAPNRDTMTSLSTLR